MLSDFIRIPFETASPVQPETLFFLGGLPMTNAMLMGVMVTLILFFIVFSINLVLKLKPGRFQLLMEWTVVSFSSLLQNIAGTRERADKLLPLIGTLFLFFGFSNLIGLVPGMTSFTYNGAPMFRTPTADFNMTFSVALAMIIMAQYASLREFGILGHLGKYLKFKGIWVGFKQGFGKGILSIVDFLIGLLDIVSELAKVFSMSLRLFGNMYAGEVMAAVLLGAFAYVIPSVWLGFNLLVALIQAMVFGALTAAYYTLAVERYEEMTT
jgi:F-type H+-transporting ATPase subunit a